MRQEDPMHASSPTFVSLSALAAGLLLIAAAPTKESQKAEASPAGLSGKQYDQDAGKNSSRLFTEGRQIFRYDTFGSEDFWGGQLKLHNAIQGQKLGGVGDGVSPKKALELGLKVDMDAVPPDVAAAIKAGQVNLDDPANTLLLLKANAVVGVTGYFNQDGKSLRSIGIQCSLCHSTVDDAFMPGIGHRLDGWPNRDLNVGQIVSLAPDTTILKQLLSVDDATLKKVLMSWGPGKFRSEEHTSEL